MPNVTSKNIVDEESDKFRFETKYVMVHVSWLKTRIKQDKTILIAMLLFNWFFFWNYILSLKNFTTKSLSAYDDIFGRFIRRSFLVKNSWTAGLGLNVAVGTPFQWMNNLLTKVSEEVAILRSVKSMLYVDMHFSTAMLWGDTTQKHESISLNMY